MYARRTAKPAEYNDSKGGSFKSLFIPPLPSSGVSQLRRYFIPRGGARPFSIISKGSSEARKLGNSEEQNDSGRKSFRARNPCTLARACVAVALPLPRGTFRLRVHLSLVYGTLHSQAFFATLSSDLPRATDNRDSRDSCGR